MRYAIYNFASQEVINVIMLDENDETIFTISNDCGLIQTDTLNIGDTLPEEHHE